MEGNDQTQKYELVPPDGGWGWLVLFGCTLINLLIPGTIKSFGVLFVEFLDIFEFSEVAASWIPALCYFLYCSLGPLTSYLTTKFSYRTITLIGGTVASVGMICSFFATSVIHLCITYGFLFGTGAGLSFPPGIFIVTSYFQKYRGFANGIAISGSAFGSMILPPLLRYLVENYGVNGAVLIMGAVVMNVWVGALFYHPVEWHMKKIPIQINEDEFIEKTEAPEVKIMDIDSTPNKCNNIRVSKMNDSHEVVNLVYTTSEKNISNSSLLNLRKLHLNCSNKGSLNSLRRNSSYLSISSIKFAGSSEGTLGRLPETASRLTLKSMESLRKYSYSKSEIEVEKTSHFLELVKNPIFIIIIISNATTAIGYTNFTIFLPAYAISLNYDKTISSYLLSIVAFFDLIGRIGGSTISDILPLHKKYYFILGLMISGISLVVLPLVETYTTLCIACAMFGLSSGTYTGITVVTMVEMLGEEKLATSYTLSLFVNGILQLVGPPICGVIYSNLNSFSTIISGLGITITIGAAVWIVLPFIPSKEE